jgi:hypothetical protein
MKEIIYLNTDIMNSMLAQLEEGLIVNYALEQNTQESETEGQQSIRGKRAGFSGQVKAGTGALPGGTLQVGANFGNDGSESSNESRTILEGQKDILNKAFHDYTLELLTNKLVENDLLTHDEENVKEGDLYLGESTYRFYDFNLLSKAMDFNAMEQIMLADIKSIDLPLKEARKILSKPNPNARERELLIEAQLVVDTHENAKPIVDIFQILNQFSSFASQLLEDLTVVKAGNKIGLLKKEYLRESAESLSFRTDNSRKIKYLVRVIGKKDVVYNGTNIPLFAEEDIDKIPNLMMDMILGSLNIIKKGDLIVTPLAIYYE